MEAEHPATGSASPLTRALEFKQLSVRTRRGDSDLKLRQTAVLVEIHDATRLIAACQQNMELVRKHLDLVLLLLGNAGRVYDEAVGEQRK